MTEPASTEIIPGPIRDLLPLPAIAGGAGPGATRRFLGTKGVVTISQHVSTSRRCRRAVSGGLRIIRTLHFFHACQGAVDATGEGGVIIVLGCGQDSAVRGPLTVQSLEVPTVEKKSSSA